MRWLLQNVAEQRSPVQCLTMLCSISQSGSLFSSPRSSSVTALRVAGSPIAQCNTTVRANATTLNVVRQVARKIAECNSTLILVCSFQWCVVIINALFIYDCTFSKADGVVYVSRCMRCYLQCISPISNNY